MRAGPSVAEERAQFLGQPTQWRVHGLILSIVFFVLTCVGVSAFYGFFALLDLIPGVLTLGICIGLAEWLIGSRRFFGTGIESALWIGGLFSFIVSLPGGENPESILLFAAAAAAAAVRLRQPYFGAAAVLMCIAYLVLKGQIRTMMVVALIVAILALIALTREWKRPSVERFFELVLIAASIAASFSNVGKWLLFVFMSVVFLAAALFMRHHAPAIASAACAVIAFIKLQYILMFQIEWQLLIAGMSMLAASWIATRALRDNRRGLVITPASITEFDEELQIAATVALQPKIDTTVAQPAPDTLPEGGGGFGGAGATGKF